MKILSPEQMASWEREALRSGTVTAKRLMLRAALACVEEIVRRLRANQKIVVICGPGNNGGDGFAIAGELARRGYPVVTYFLGARGNLSPEATFFQSSVSCLELKTAKAWSDFKRDLGKSDGIVDALFGIGLKRDLAGNFQKAIHAINRSRAFVVAVDLPSGIDGETGKARGAAVRADVTVTFEAPKWGHLLRDGLEQTGELVVAPIGLPLSKLSGKSILEEWLEAKSIAAKIPRRRKTSHKGQGGKVLIFAGSEKMPGAGYLTALAALRSGAGTVTWALPEELYRRLDFRLPELMFEPLPSKDGGFAEQGREFFRDCRKRFDAFAIGPGLGRGRDLPVFLEQCLRHLPHHKVLDADALNLLAQHRELLKLAKGSILTPHPREMARLTGLTVKEVLEQRIEIARDFAASHKLYVVLKGYRSILATPQKRIWLNSTGGPNLATPGSGDVLTGMIAAYLAQGLSLLAAMQVAVYLHGLAGDRLAETQGNQGTLASEVANRIPEILKKLDL